MILINLTSVPSGGGPILSNVVTFSGGNTMNAAALVSATEWNGMTLTLQGSLDGVNWVDLAFINSGDAAIFTQAIGSSFQTLQGLTQSAKVRCSVAAPSTTVTGIIRVDCDNVY